MPQVTPQEPTIIPTSRFESIALPNDDNSNRGQLTSGNLFCEFDWRFAAADCMHYRIQRDSCAGNVVVAVPLFDVLLCHASLDCTAFWEEGSRSAAAARRISSGAIHRVARTGPSPNPQCGWPRGAGHRCPPKPAVGPVTCSPLNNRPGRASSCAARLTGRWLPHRAIRGHGDSAAGEDIVEQPIGDRRGLSRSAPCDGNGSLRQRKPSSPPAFVHSRFDLAAGRPAPSLPAGDFRPESPQPHHGLTQALGRRAAFGNDHRYRFLVPRDDDLLAIGDAVQ